MPNGRFSPVAKVDCCSGFPSFVTPRKTAISPLEPSAKKISPFGAVNNFRGSSIPVAKSWTLNPGSDLGIAPSGRGAGTGKLFADLDANGAGKSLVVSL